MPSVVQFGAGAIGRGFVGQLWSEAGYEVVFVEVNEQIASLLNQRGSYPLRLVDGNDAETRTIGPVRALSVRDHRAVAAELQRCAFACTAVGVSVFEQLGELIAAGLAQRDSTPFNILCCENQIGAGEMLRKATWQVGIPPNPESVGFVDVSVGRMVPPPTPTLLAEDPLLVVAEPYKLLPMDAAAWVGPVPAVAGLQPKPNFAAYVARKIFVHNGGHAVLAYEGALQGYSTIWQAADNQAIVTRLHAFWGNVNGALLLKFGLELSDLVAYEDDLFRRFRNRALGDTVARVGRDPARKLRADDRLVGAALLCLEQDIIPLGIARTIAAALLFDAPEDPTAVRVREMVAQGGVRYALHKLAGISTESPLAALVDEAYNNLTVRRHRE